MTDETYGEPELYADPLFNQVVPNPKPAKKIADPKYMEFVKQLPCVICDNFQEPYGYAPSDLHHTICGRFGGGKTADAMGIPLCKAHHQTGEHGKTAIHQNKTAWVEQYGPDTDYILITQARVLTEFGYSPLTHKETK